MASGARGTVDAMSGRILVVAVAAVTAVALAGCDAGGGLVSRPATPAPAPTRAATDTSAAAPSPSGAGSGAAVRALAALAVQGRASRTGYSRDRFGGEWLLTGGCDTRDRILRRDLDAVAPEAGCAVESGVLADPYTGASIRFVRGDAAAVDIDHVVALGDAWQTGAQGWTAARRVAFANDPLNLLAVDASANRQKGDGDAATWLPHRRAYRCAYVARQVAVKRRYHAWVTPPERDAIARILARCPGEPLPTAPRPRVAHVADGVFPDCGAVRAAGLAPLRRGTPAYAANARLDGDGDGVACE
jgi:hypothetical protein